jgi:DNA repair exonuclease SbcCD ATPase subunit
MFLQITEVHNDVLELQCLEPNLHIAKKWARNALNHIARVLNPVQYVSAFTDSENTLIHSTTIDEWKPPPPPTIQSMPDVWKKDIPRTISKQDGKKQPSKRKTYTQAQDFDNDNNTTTTVNTQGSYTQDTISELQSNSYQHQQLIDAHNKKFEALEQKILHTDHYQQLVDSHTERLEEHESEMTAHTQRLNTLDSQTQEKFSSFTSNLATLEEEQQVQQRHQEQLARDIANCSTQLPTLTETMEQQQKQLIKYFRRQNKINAQTDNEIKKLRETQATHQTMITTLQAIVLSLQNSGPPTPMSQQRLRKRLKPRTQTETSILEDSDMESEVQPNELHQLHAITSLQNQSLEHLSFIAHPMDDSTLDDELLLTWDDTSTENEDSTNLSSVDAQAQHNEQNDHEDPGLPNSGGDT